mgnify:FL=1
MNFEPIKKRLIYDFECETIILFGSFARGTQNEKSDIDIAFKSKRKISKKEIFEEKILLEDISKRDIDLVNLDEINDDFRYEILMNGKELYCENKTKFDLYKIDMFREYIDLNESRLSIMERVKKGGTIYGK